jgi:hypothetical protein
MAGISWKTGSTGLWSDSANWSTGTVPGSSSSVTISVAPATSGTPYIVEIESAVTVGTITLDQSEATLGVYDTTLGVSDFTLTAGTLDLEFSTLTVASLFALGAGTLALDGSVLQGGIYKSAAGTVQLLSYGGTFSSLAWHGLLDLTTQEGGQATLESVTFAGSNGSGNGTLTIGSGVTTNIDQSTLSSVDVGLASGDYLYVETTTFTLAAGSTLSTTGSTLSGYIPSTVLDLESGGALTNKGVITDASGADLTIDTGTLANTGTISVSNGGTIDISTSGSTASTNSGHISVGAGSYLELDSTGGGGFTSTGTVSVAGTLGIDAALTSAQLAKFTVATGTLALQGTLTNTAATLTVSSAKNLANLWLDDGEIIGGKIVSTGDFVATGGTLSGVTLDGTLSVSTPSTSYYQTLDITGSFITAGSTGTGLGSLAISGAEVDFETSTTLTNVAITLGSADYIGTIEAGTSSETAGTTLTIGSGVQITTSGSTSLTVATANDALVNHGTITAGVQGAPLTLDGLTNDGLISVTGGSTIYWFPNTYSSTATTIVNAGTLSVDNSTLEIVLYSGSSYTFDNTGLMSLTGTSTQVYYYEQMQFANSGTVQVAGGATLDLGYSGETWSNSGTFLLSGGFVSLGGTFTAAQIGKAVISDGGALEIGGTLTNSGTLSIGTGSTLTALTLTESGEISGGTIKDGGGGLIGAGGTLSAVDYHGTISLGAENAYLDFTGGLTMAGSSGTGTGTILADGIGSHILIIGSQTFNDTAIDIGVPGNTDYTNVITFTDPSSTASTLTLAATSSLADVATTEIVGSYAYSGTGYGPTGDTLVNDGSITETTSLGHLSTYYLNLINAASISIQNGSAFDFGDGTLTNQGTLLISGTGVSNGGTYDAELAFDSGYSNDFINTALVTIGTGGVLDLDSNGLVWSNTGSIKVAGGQLDLGGTITTGQFGSITVSAGGDVAIDGDGYLENTGYTLTVGGKSALGTIQLTGNIDGGTIDDTGGGIVFGSGYNSTAEAYGGSLENVRYIGVLDLSSTSETASIIGSLHILSSTGASHGTISLTGEDAELDFTTTSTLTSTSITIGNSIDPPTLTGTNLFLASSDIIEQEGAYAAIGSFDGSIASTITNAGSIAAAQAGSILGLFGDLANSGDIAVSNGETLYLDTSTLTNTGSISVTNGLLEIGDVTSNQLTEVKLVNSQLAVIGVVTNTGSTLTVGTGTDLPYIELDGEIVGGTIKDAGGGVGIFGYAVMDGVTYEGTLELNIPLGQLTILDGLTATGSSGSGNGSIALTGAGAQLVWDSTQTLNNATISIGNPGVSYEATGISAPSILSGYAEDEKTATSSIDDSYYSTVLLGSKLTINQTGTYANIGGVEEGEGYVIPGLGGVTSAATINVGFAGGEFSFESAEFINTGTIAISSTDTLIEGAGTFTNAGVITIGAGSTLSLNTYNYFADVILTPYALTNTGTISLAGGTFTEPTENGSFPNVPLLNSATISGFGTIQSEITNDGTITAAGGTLSLGESVTGTGALAVDAGATLSLAGVSTGETATFSGTGGILGLAPATFLGEIGGFASGDTIDLASTTATAASFSGTSLVVTLSTGSTIKLTTTTALTGSLKTTAGTHGDTLITFAGSGSHEPGLPSPIAPPLVPYADPEQATVVAAPSLFQPQTAVEIWSSHHML